MPAPTIAGSKRSGKENAPPAKTKHRETDDDFDEGDDDFGAYAADPIKVKAAVKPSSKTKPPTSRKASEDVEEGEDFTSAVDDVRRTKPTSAKQTTVAARKMTEDVEGGGGKDVQRQIAELQRKLSTITSERDRLKNQRETFAKQFEELSKLRTTDTEALFERYKEKSALQAKAQVDIISSLTQLNEKLQTRTQSLEKSLSEAVAKPVAALPSAGGPFEAESSKRADPKEVARLHSIVKARDAKITHLEKELATEVALAKSLQTKSKATDPVTSQSEESEKDDLTMKLYEDMTDLNIMNVRVKPGRYGKEVTFNCVQSVGKRSLNFKLKSFSEPSAELLAQKAENPYIPTISFTPENLECETDKDFLAHLGTFAEAFKVPRVQLGGLLESLKSAMLGEGDEE
ncbi:hypothetical protein P7C73_g745, partial [Tremellales sp. Uapishka_1]